jgi:glycine cleavage system H protein
MNLPDNLKFTANHEWARAEADGSISCGITARGQELLGDMVYVGAPECGRRVEAQEACGVVESVKAASDLHAPLAEKWWPSTMRCRRAGNSRQTPGTPGFPYPSR